MEFWQMKEEKVKNDDKRNWYLHKFGVIDKSGSDFLDVVEERINSAIQQELFSIAERSGNFASWIENKELPITVVDVGKSKFLVCRKDNYYETQDGRKLLDGFELPRKLAAEMTEVLYRGGKELDNKERKCAFWILKKMGVKVKWKE